MADVVALIGTKAQYIKMAPVIGALGRVGVSCVILHSGQHAETISDISREFGLETAVLDLVPGMEASTNARFAKWVLRFRLASRRSEVRELLGGARIVMVHGDTASTILGARLAHRCGAMVAHVEAGLTSGCWHDPFPEELIRRLVRRAADIHYPPDQVARDHLLAKGVPESSVFASCGNTLMDALKQALARPAVETTLPAAGIVSIHRTENLSNRKRFDFLMQCVADAAGSGPVKFVLHPATRQKLASTGWMDRLGSVPGLSLTPRMSYFDFVSEMLAARFLMTDGGSNQEECAALGLPTLLMRQHTERQDGIGSNVLLSRLDPASIRRFIADPEMWRRPRNIPEHSPSMLIAEDIARRLGHGD